VRIELQAPAWATHLLSDLTDWQRAPLPVADLAPCDLPDDAYFEYAWLDKAGERRADPANANPRRNPWWPYACNIAGPRYEPDPDAAAAAAGGGPRGRVLRLSVASDILDQNRHFLVYTPAGHGEDTLPLVLFQDGKAYFGWGRVPQVCDRLLARGEIGPAHLVFVPPSERTREYAFNPDYRRFLRDELLPAAEARVRCDGRRIAWGASLGGLLSATLAWENPELFQRVVTQSGAFLFSPDMQPGNPFSGTESLRRQVLSEPPRRLAWHLECGTLEWLLDSNRNLAAALADRGMPAALLTRNAGHNWVNWQDGIAGALRFALGDAR